MKKILISFLMLLAGAGSLMAQNKLHVDDITLPQNGEATLTVNFQFDAADTYTGYSFNIELPTELAFAMEEGTDVACVKGSCHDASHSVTANLSDGLVKVAGLSLSSKPLQKTKGVLLQFTVKPAAELAVGQTFTGSIKDILIVPVEGTKQNLAASTFTVTIGQPADTRTVLDENATTQPTALTGVDVRVKRTVKANEWSTICLPFAMTAEQVKAAFGNDVTVADFKGTDTEFDEADNLTAIKANFATVSSIEPNHPYIIKVSEPVEEFTVDGVDIEPDEDKACVEFDNGKTGSRRVVYSGFYGTFRAGTVLQENTLFLSENKFWYSTGETEIKAFRAYFDFLDVLDGEPGERIAIILDGNDTTTGVDEAARQMNDDKRIKDRGVYDLQGRKVDESQLKKGIYILDNKKFMY